MRVAIAGLAGAIAMFIWASVAHTLTPLASAGLAAMPNEAAIVAALHKSLGDKPGLYFFPSMSGANDPSMAAKLAASPHGLLAYNPPSADSGVTPRQLVTEFVLELIESVLTAVVIGVAVTRGFAGRVGVAAAVGAAAAIATNFSYWNWYGFSLDYTLGNAFVELMKFIFAGAVIALVLGRRSAKAT